MAARDHRCHIPIRTVEYEARSPKIGKGLDGCRIAFLTDLHGNLHGKGNRRLLSAIGEARPDLILCAGDMIVGRQGAPVDTALSLFSHLSRRFRCVCSLGNHEQKLRARDPAAYSSYAARLRKMGVILLDNGKAFLGRGGDRIAVTGLTADFRYYGKAWRRVRMTPSYVRDVVGEAERDTFQILLAHNPEHFKAYAAWGADLVLSGHVHGGIVAIPGVGGLISPSLRLFPKYDFGAFREGDCLMAVSRGLGSHTIHLRVFNPPELSIVTLRSQPSPEGEG